MAHDGAEHCLEIKSRADRLADFSQRFEFPDRPSQFAGSRFQFLEQPHVLDGDHRLVGEGFEQLDLLVCERANFSSANHNHSDRQYLRAAAASQASCEYQYLLRSWTPETRFQSLPRCHEHELFAGR